MNLRNYQLLFSNMNAFQVIMWINYNQHHSTQIRKRAGRGAEWEPTKVRQVSTIMTQSSKTLTYLIWGSGSTHWKSLIASAKAGCAQQTQWILHRTTGSTRKCNSFAFFKVHCKSFTKTASSKNNEQNGTSIPHYASC